MISDHETITMYECYICFLYVACCDHTKTGSAPDSSTLDRCALADKRWPGMLDSGLRDMLLEDHCEHVDPDERLVDYFHKLIERDGFVDAPAYWAGVRHAWHLHLTEGRPLFGKDADRQRQMEALRLRVITTTSPETSPRKGICSPIKTDEIRRFEKLAQDVFGDVGSCRTGW